MTGAAVQQVSGLILAAGPAGRCDDHRLGGAVVVHDAAAPPGSEAAWRMWYYCRRHDGAGPPTLGTGTIAMAVSEDGMTWRRHDGTGPHGAVFAPAATGFDSLHIGISDIVATSEGYHMWYFAGDHAPRTTAAFGDVVGLGMRPGLAFSADGTAWDRIPGRDPAGDGAQLPLPGDTIYRAWPNVFEGPSGPILQVTEAASDLSGFRTSVWTPCPDRGWRSAGCLSFAEPSPGYDSHGLVTRQVLANPLPGGRRFLMIYTGTDARHQRAIAAADSDDGLVWHRLYGEPIFAAGEPGAWDSLGVAATRLVVAGGRIHLYYYGFQTLGDASGLRGIGLATASLHEGDLRSLRRVDAGAV
ncbi:hypothetical protein [Novosphingobium resinovorum]|uniref:hypothetical protein n=1 Tax=Novosphingobium resinovorum TaxID=158500 RepID=UPI002ED479E7|nr:hypothetical protein [Novosphingobium resinovorum]